MNEAALAHWRLAACALLRALLADALEEGVAEHAASKQTR